MWIKYWHRNCCVYYHFIIIVSHADITLCCYVMLRYITLHYIISYHITSLHNMLSNVMLYYVMLCCMFSILFYSILFYSTLLYSTLLYSTLLYSTLLYSTLLYSTLLNSTMLCYAMLCYAMLYYTIWHFGNRCLHQCNPNKKEKNNTILKLCYDIYTNFVIFKLQKCSSPQCPWWLYYTILYYIRSPLLGVCIWY